MIHTHLTGKSGIRKAEGFIMKNLRERLGKVRTIDTRTHLTKATDWLRVSMGLGILLVVLFLSSCKSIGPKVVLKSHIDYNKAVEQVIQEELLLNIVRRRYYEAPQFVTISNINATMSFSAGASGGASTSLGGSGNAGANIGYSNTPTITFTPRQGHEILGPLTSRMSVLTIASMAQAGYRFDFLLALMVEGLTDVRGPEAGVGTDFRPGDPEYIKVIQSIGRLMDNGQLKVGTFSWNDPYSDIAIPREEITVDNQLTAIALGSGVGRFRSYDGGENYYFTDKHDYPAMWIDPEARTSTDGKYIIQTLNLQPTPLKRVWSFSPNRVVEGTDFENVPDDPRPEVRMQLRTFYSVLNLLAYGIKLPPGDEEEGRAFTKALYDKAVSEGRAVDLSDKFVVNSSKGKRPENAFVAVKHRDTWFYVDDRDYASKRFFNAVYDLFNMEIAPSGGGGSPVLTIPVK
ncbi:MAG: hypothetical protein HWE09_10370 [Cyclobacteriaceae bacterium]|uniref:hypothetical protein n=1 Tax=Algoriphagus sp. TaxID=1872435 RepID=UPI0018525BCC|nr:hypothetical protein [Algoriphagus sp.]NVJ85764.1 hypothetical protein [Algoriphagus sp.]NVK50165.1 hypothetical protein [Cyclobacteriaceae bacterium]